MTQILGDDPSCLLPTEIIRHSLGLGADLPKPSDGPPSRAAVPRSGVAVSAGRKQKASPSGLADDSFGESPCEGEVFKLHLTAVIFNSNMAELQSRMRDRKAEIRKSLKRCLREPAISV